MGVYKGDDRAVIAYRVSWPDQKIIETTINGLEHSLFENRIHIIGKDEDYILSTLFG